MTGALHIVLLGSLLQMLFLRYHIWDKPLTINEAVGVLTLEKIDGAARVNKELGL